MSLLSEFTTTPDRRFPCGCAQADTAACACGLSAGHGGVEVGDVRHRTVCSTHTGAALDAIGDLVSDALRALEEAEADW